MKPPRARPSPPKAGLHAVIETLRTAWPSSVPYQRLTESVVAAMPDASADEHASAVVDT